MEPAANPGPKVLLVDDEPSIRLLLRTFLEQNGFVAEEAEDGESAYVKILKFDPAIVLLDILMPVTTGNELVEAIKEWKPHIQVIMVTAVVSSEMKLECLAKGAFDVIHKPIDFEVLKSRILAAWENVDRKFAVRSDR